jgi:hypothetical protein
MKTVKLSLILTMLLGAFTGFGCAEEEGMTPGSSAFKGTYEIESWVKNNDGCDVAEGSQAGNDDKYMVIESCSFSFSGQIDGQSFSESDSWLRAFTCNDDAGCEKEKCEPNEITLSPYTFESGNDEDGWVSFMASGGKSDTGTCTANVWVGVLSSTDGDDLAYIIKQLKVEGVPTDEDGWCDLDAAEEMKDQGECVGIEVITLTPKS